MSDTGTAITISSAERRDRPARRANAASSFVRVCVCVGRWLVVRGLSQQKKTWYVRAPPPRCWRVIPSGLRLVSVCAQSSSEAHWCTIDEKVSEEFMKLKMSNAANRALVCTCPVGCFSVMPCGVCSPGERVGVGLPGVLATWVRVLTDARTG